MKHAANRLELGLRRNCRLTHSNMSFVVSLMRLHSVRSRLFGVSILPLPPSAPERKRMKLPPDVEFHEDVRLVVWRPRGVVNRAAVNRIINVIGELEATLKEPFNRFADTLQADAVDLNIEYLIRVFLYRRFFYGKRPKVKAAVLATDPPLSIMPGCMRY